MVSPRASVLVAVVVVSACAGVTALAVQGRADAEQRESQALAREEAAVAHLPGRGSIAEQVTGPAASAREEALRDYFRSDVLGAVNRVGTAAMTSACADPTRSPQQILDDVATATDLPELVTLPDDEWRALLDTEHIEAELARCGTGP